MKREYLDNLTKKPLKWGDLVLILTFALLLILPLVLVHRPAGAVVEIYRNQTLVASLPLDADTDFTYRNNGVTNVIRIRGGEAFVLSADCPDKLCTRFAPISRQNETILCVPSGLRVVIAGGSAGDVDGETSEVAL